MAALERSSQEQSEKVRLLEAWVEALEQDNSALQDKASKLQEKAKALAKEKKGILLFFDACIFQISRPRIGPRVLWLLPKLNYLCRRCRSRRRRSRSRDQLPSPRGFWTATLLLL